MNIFVIPSWYPTQEHPQNGIFVYEQVRLLAACQDDNNLGVSLFNQGDTDAHFSPVKKNAITVLKKYYKAAGSRQRIRFNLWEFYYPAFTWPKHFLDGDTRLPELANEQNFLSFKELTGKVDIIHAHVGFPAGYLAYKLSRKYGLPYIVTEHMSPFPFKSLLSKGRLSPKLEEALIKSNMITAVSNEHAREIKSFVNSAIQVIPNFIDETQCAFNMAPRMSTEHSFPVFFTLGLDYHQKGIDILIEAIALIRDALPQKTRFVIAGNDDPAPWRHLSIERGVDHLIEWRERVSRTISRQLFDACDVFILPSRHESFGVVLIEALAHGKPLIATRCGGPEDIVTETNGILTEKNDPAALAKAIKKMATDFQNYSPLRIRSDFEARFGSRIIANKINSLYHDVITKQ